MIRAAHSTGHRIAALASSSLLLLGAATAMAGPVNTNHRFEHIGRAVSDVAAILPMPGFGRALVLEHDGDIHLTTGDRLVDDTIYRIPVSQFSPGDGLLDGTWHLTAAGTVLYVTYIQPSPRKLAVARLEFEGDKVVMFNDLFSVAIAPTANSNYGGGITMGMDLKLYVGIGDLGNSGGAQQPTTLVGKIFRLNSDLPGGIPADNPISPTSPVFASGVRNPMRLATDTEDGTMYFIDVGPSMNDEVNLLNPRLNYGWSRYSGRSGVPGMTDPIFTWATAIQPTGLEVNRAANFGTGALGDIVVSSGTGRVSMLHPNNPALATETTIYLPGGGEPASWQDVSIRHDGYAYVTDPGGDVWRLRNNAAAMQEPSDLESITPLLVRKLTPTQLEISAERETQLADFGLYTGDLTLSRANGRANWYTHPLESTTRHAPDGQTSEAMSKFMVSRSGLPTVAYFLVSGVNTRAETVLGYDSQNVLRPGGNLTFGCPCPDTAVAGHDVDTCAYEFTLAQGVHGQSAPGVFNHVGEMNFPDDWDCHVILLDISMEWCGPCRNQARTAQALLDSYAGQPVMFVHVVPEDSTGAPANMATAERWTRDFGLNFPVYPDDAADGLPERIWRLYDIAHAIPQTWIIGKDGVVTNWFLGTQGDDVLRAAIDAALAR
jgi:glucose/arabinose dehydrogenase/thiol-disulfide isomerase/thioredoxin